MIARGITKIETEVWANLPDGMTIEVAVEKLTAAGNTVLEVDAEGRRVKIGRWVKTQED